MRKFLIAAIAALASIALASVAVAQSPEVEATTKVAPSKAGTKKKPKPTSISTFVKNNIEGSTASKIEIDFPSTVKISGKGLTKCALAEFSKPGGRANCPAKSKAGVGITHAVLGPQRAPLNFKVNAYVGGNNLVIFYIEQIGGSVTKALQGPITSTSSAVSVVTTAAMSVPSSILPPCGRSETEAWIGTSRPTALNASLVPKIAALTSRMSSRSR